MREILLDANIAEAHLPIIFYSRKDAENKFADAVKKFQDDGYAIVCAELFGSQWLGEVARKFLPAGIPVNHILPLDENKTPHLSGAHLTALRGVKPEFKKIGNERAAIYSAGPIRYCRSFGITPGRADGNGYDETVKNLSAIKSLLDTCGYKFTDIARTWFYNFELLDWYTSFNRARTEFFEREGIFKSLLPASTGIGAPNSASAKISSGILALKDSDNFGGGTWSVQEVYSPLQCGAPQYGSSFSRAVEIGVPTSRRIIISGTASIEHAGATAYVGDIDKQVDLTMRVIKGILVSRGMDFSDTIRAIAYCQSPEYYEVFKKWCAKNVEIAHCPSFSTVCRHDLLFEVELDAAKNR